MLYAPKITRKMVDTIYEKPRHLDDDVLEEGVPFDGVVDLRLVLVRQVDRLRVAAALEVEDAVVVPACRRTKAKPDRGEVAGSTVDNIPGILLPQRRNRRPVSWSTVDNIPGILLPQRRN